MKKILLLLMAISFIGLFSCEKNNSDEPGQISGMGTTAGDLQIKKSFVMPEGISVVGEITGIENPGLKNGGLKSVLVNDSKSGISHYGSGLQVRLRLTLLNSRNYPRTVFFPKGLIFKCINGNYQHGLTCQTTWVCFKPNEIRTVYVDLYCVNQSIPGPDQDGKYMILGITSSKIIWDLLNKIGWRKINFEWFQSTKGDSGPTYYEITEKLQTIVHNLTDRGIAISAEDEAFINSIPELSPEDRPVVDENAQYPEYFEELKPPVK